MRFTRTKIILLTAITLAGNFSAAAQSNAPGDTDYAKFSSFITDRNIFDPNRYPHNSRSTPTRTKTRTRTRAPGTQFIALVGTMSYEKGLFAFFNANDSDLKKILTAGDEIAGYTVKEITASAVTLTFAAGQAFSNVDFHLAPGASIAGTVTNASCLPVAGAPVLVYNAAGTLAGSTTASTAGVYRVAGLPAGGFFVRTKAADLNHVDEWYQNVPAAGLQTPSAASPVLATSGESVVQIDFGLEKGAAIAGRVIDTNGLALTGVYVNVYDVNTNWLRSGTTGSNGDYQVQGLAAPGPVYVRTDAGSAPYPYADSWYWNVPALSAAIPTDAIPVYVAAGVTESNVVFVLSQGGTISGVILDVQGRALSGVQVDLYAADGTSIVSVQTASDGAYQFSGLSAGIFYVRTHAASLNYVDQWSGGTSVDSGSVVSNVSFALQPGGSITGRVTDTHGVALAGVSVVAYDAGTNWMQSANTGVGGDYVVSGLSTAGVYYVRTSSGSLNCFDAWFDSLLVTGSGIPTSAAALGVTTSHAATANFAIQRAGAIAGAVSDQAGSALSGIGVSIYRTNGVLAAATTTAASGAYAVTQLLPGSYVVRTVSGAYGFEDQWCGGLEAVGSSVPAAAARIDVAEGAVTNAGFSLPFRVVTVGDSNGLFWLRWQAASGSVYAIERLLRPGMAWTNAPDGSNAVEQSYRTGPGQCLLDYRDLQSAPTNASWYRVRLVP